MYFLVAMFVYTGTVALKRAVSPEAFCDGFFSGSHQMESVIVIKS